MQTRMRKFLKILKIELEELEDELKLVGELNREREKCGEITPYVFIENINLIQREISGLDTVIASVDNLVSTKYENFEEMLTDLDTKIKQKIKESDYADAVYVLVKRKFDKVHTYLTDET